MPQKVLVTDVWWAGHALNGIFFQREIYYAPSRDQFDRLLPRLRQRGVREFLFVTQPRPGVRPNVRVDDGGLDVYTLDFIVSPLE